MEIRPFLLHALSPLHAGTGQSVDLIDLPIARMRATGMPFLPGSSIKGVLRDAQLSPVQQRLAPLRKRQASKDGPEAPLSAEEQAQLKALAEQEQAHFSVFGPDTENAADHAGALTISDARLLALPVRSFAGTFALVSSPLLLALALRDLAEAELAGLPQAAPARLPQGEARVGDDSSLNLYNSKDKSRVYLEDLDLEAKPDAQVKAWGAFLATQVAAEDPDALRQRFLVVDDETMTFLWETCTQVDTRIRLNPETRTVAKGALWTEESLPPETLLLGLLAANPSLNGKAAKRLTATQVLDAALGQRRTLQFGGKATVGRGRCRVIPLLGQGA